MKNTTKISKQIQLIKNYVDTQICFFPWRKTFSGQDLNLLLNEHGIGMDHNVRARIIKEGIFKGYEKTPDGSLAFYLD